MPLNSLKLCLLIVSLLSAWINMPSCGLCQSEALQSADDIDNGQKHWALIIVGLPGDDAHAQQFAEVSSSWQQRLQTLGIPADHIQLLRDKAIGEVPDEQSLTRDVLLREFSKLGQKVQADDTLWVFLLGHANYDDGRAAFHVRGVDPDDSDLASALDSIQCRQQVVWLTNSCSGWFVKRLSGSSRIVIAATAADHEPNETEFPNALATVLERGPAELDQDADQHISVMELFAATAAETEKRYAADRRLPTEHAQLDDNGDGKGTEIQDIKVRDQRTVEEPLPPTDVAATANSMQDGQAAASVLLPITLPNENTSSDTIPGEGT